MGPMKQLGIVALLALVGLGPAPAVSPTREEEKLLLEVGKRMLQWHKQNPTNLWSAFDCAWYVTGSMDETLVRPEDLRPLPPSLLGELRKAGPQLRQCVDTTIEGVFRPGVMFLGPVEWEKPSKDAVIGCDIGHPTAGRACFTAHRGLFGRWTFRGVVQL